MKKESINNFINLGAEIVGAASSSILGFYSSSPEIAGLYGVSAPVITSVIKNVASDIKERFLSKKEEKRIGAVISFATLKIKENFEKGKELRQDFFGEDGDKKSAEEIFEGIILVSQREHEENKIKYLGNLFANLAFDNSYSKIECNTLIKISEQLSYNQFCLLTFVNNRPKFSYLRKMNYREQESFSKELIFVLQEIFELYNHNLVAGDGTAWLGLSDINPSKIEPVGLGIYLYRLMELYKIDNLDLSNIINNLSE